MLEASLSLVAAFAAYTAYAIVGDEIRSNRPANKTTGKRTTPAAENKRDTAAGVRTAKAPAKTKATASSKTKTTKPSKATGTQPVSPDAILAYLAAHGPVTITNLAKALNSDKAAVALAAKTLIANKAAISIKRGGYPGIAPKG